MNYLFATFCVITAISPMPAQAGQGPLIGLHHGLARQSHAPGILWQLDQAAYSASQSLGIIHLLQGTGLTQHGGDLEEIEHMRSHDHRQGQRSRLQWVVPAGSHQASADEGDISQCVEEQQFAHGVAQQHRSLAVHRRPQERRTVAN